MKLLKKYGGLTIEDPDVKEVYTLSSTNLYWVKERGGGWYVVAETAEYDGSNANVLEIYEINDHCLMEMLIDTEQPAKLNIQKIFKDEENSDGEVIAEVVED